MHIYIYIYIYVCIYNIMHTGLEYVGIGTAGLEQLPGRDPPEPSPLPAFPSVPWLTPSFRKRRNPSEIAGGCSCLPALILFRKAAPFRGHWFF